MSEPKTSVGDVSVDEVDSIGLGCALESFKEYDEIHELISNLHNVYDDQTQSETLSQRFLYILNQYQEQPHLLDKYLVTFLENLLSIAGNVTHSKKLQHLAFKFLYIVTKVRGFKVVVRHLPHEVSDVEKVLCLLEEQDPQDFDTWETRYMLLLWLSIIVMIPFDLARFDNTDIENNKPIMRRIVDVIKLYLSVGDKARDAAAFLSSRFINRPDVRALYFEEHLNWSLQMLASTDENTMSGLSLQSGILSCLALLFKHGKREDIKEYSSLILKKVLKCGFSSSKSTIVRKMFLKLIQRIGLSFLKIKIAKWRYSRGTRCLADNLAQGDLVQNYNSTCNRFADEDSENDSYDIPDEIEDVIDQLLVGLRDKDTILRWSAAKGIGRITNRLPKELADDVVTSVLELFTLRESDSAWHGGCLALAELGRRGLILPQHLLKVVNVVLKALVYDEIRGNFSVGAHIRDAACYVCWSFARAYDPSVLQPYVNNISGALLVAAVFDREINCRRAASAAFQENVGRQGTFPHGIELLTFADYYAVGSRTNAFLHISACIGKFPEYALTLINHLLEYKVNHWDSTIRELSSKALHNLTAMNAQYMVSDVLPKLILWADGADLNARHGAILSIAEIVHALFLCSQNNVQTLFQLLDESIVRNIRNIAFSLKTKNYFRGLGGILTLCAINTLIEKLSSTSVLFQNDKELIAVWQEILETSLQHKELSVRSSAVAALPYLCTCYLSEAPDCISILLKKYLSQLKANRMEILCGYALAIGSLPYFMLKDHLPDILNALSECASLSTEHNSWAETRRDAIKAIAQVVTTVTLNTNNDGTENMHSVNINGIYSTLLAAMDDYTVDSRGEVGAIVREAAMQAIQDVTFLVPQRCPEVLTEDLISTIFSAVLQQCVEKIDRTRFVAGSVFSALLHSESLKPYISFHDEFEKVFPLSVCSETNWAAPSDTFHLFIKLVPLEKFTFNLLMGFTVSVGGLTESLVKYSRSALVSYLFTLTPGEKLQNHIADTLITILQNNLKNDRILVPFFKMMNYLFISGVVFPVTSGEIPFNEKLVDLVWQSSYKSSDPQKLFAAIDLFCDFLQFEGASASRSMSRLTIFLCHRFPRVRTVTASKMYEAFVTYDLLAIDVTDEVLNVLTEVDWNQPVEVLRPIRNSLCEKLCVPIPSVKKS